MIAQTFVHFLVTSYNIDEKVGTYENNTTCFSYTF